MMVFHMGNKMCRCGLMRSCFLFFVFFFVGLFILGFFGGGPGGGALVKHEDKRCAVIYCRTMGMGPRG